MGVLPTHMRNWAFVLIAILIGADQLTKWWILTDVMAPPRIIDILPFANLVLVWNPGVSFGMFNTGSPWAPWILSGFALAVCVFLMIWMFRQADARVTYGIAMIVGGAVGNVIDRLVHGAVVDFVDLHAGGYHWPAFNVADAAITVGAVLLVLDSLFHRDKSS